MRIVKPDVKHIVYEGSPTSPNHGELRVSYSHMHGVFVTRWHGSCGRGEYHDDTLSGKSLDLLRSMVPWLYRAGMPVSYEAREGGLGLEDYRSAVMLGVQISLRSAEDREWEAEQGVMDKCAYEMSSGLYTLNRAGEWIRWGNQKPIDLTIQHRLWYAVIKEMAAAADALDASLAGHAIHSRVIGVGVDGESSAHPGEWIPVRVPKRDPGE